MPGKKESVSSYLLYLPLSVYARAGNEQPICENFHPISEDQHKETNNTLPIELPGNLTVKLKLFSKINGFASDNLVE